MCPRLPGQRFDEAGFSQGVVYSQFGTKADLFFAREAIRGAEVR
jgi:hypothetical protein